MQGFGPRGPEAKRARPAAGRARDQSAGDYSSAPCRDLTASRCHTKSPRAAVARRAKSGGPSTDASKPSPQSSGIRFRSSRDASRPTSRYATKRDSELADMGSHRSGRRRYGASRSSGNQV
jgi:hypothetical protein